MFAAQDGTHLAQITAHLVIRIRKQRRQHAQGA
jgi:hypothetical protein